MVIFITGLVIFLGVHFSRALAPQWRADMIAKLGEQRWKGVYTLASLVGFALLVWGYSIARQTPVVLWVAPLWVKHLALLLTWVAFVLVTAAYVPRNHVKAAVGHPMVLGAKTWAFAHVLANGRLPALLLFGAFLVWAIVLFARSRRSDRLQGVSYAQGEMTMTLLTVAAGTAIWAIFAFYLHTLLIGVNPIAT